MKKLIESLSKTIGEGLEKHTDFVLQTMQASGDWPEWSGDSGIYYGDHLKHPKAKKGVDYLAILDCADMAQDRAMQQRFIDAIKRDIFIKKVSFVDGDDIYFGF